MEKKVFKKLMKDNKNKNVFGVTSGFCKYFGLNTLLIRLALFIFILASGSTGLVIYFLLYFFIDSYNPIYDQEELDKEIIKNEEANGKSKKGQTKILEL